MHLILKTGLILKRL